MENFVMQDFSFCLVPQAHPGSENNLIFRNIFFNLKTTEQITF